jgi:RNA polymerase sigma-70 factor (ECF subfamily)
MTKHSLDATAQAKFRADLIAILPPLRAFARGLCGNRDLADDLVQEAVTKAWAARTSFQPGTNFRAWMFRILRNHFYTVATVARRFVPYDPELGERLLSTPPTQGGERMMHDLERGLATLPATQREALVLMAAGLQWDEIATLMECPLGTIKSRITRGRAALKAYLDGPDDDPPVKARTDTAAALAP